MWCAVLNKFWKQYTTKQWLHGHLPPISQTIQVREATYVGNSSKSKDKPSDILLWTHQCWPNSKNASALCRHRMSSRGLIKSDDDDFDDMNERQFGFELNLIVKKIDSSWISFLDQEFFCYEK